MENINDLAVKAIGDLEFRKRLLADPEGTVKAEGLNVTDKEMAAIKELKEEDFENLSLEDLDERLSKADGCSAVIGVGIF